MAGGAAAVLAAALVIYALVVEPVWGWWYMRRLRQRVRVDDEARVDGYRLIIATEWTLAGCALLAYTLSDLAPHEVFLVLLVVAALLLPAVQVWVLALGVAVVFGLAHVYQGAAGVVVTSMMGAVLACSSWRRAACCRQWCCTRRSTCAPCSSRRGPRPRGQLTGWTPWAS